MPATKKTPERVRASADATRKRAEAALKRAGGSLDEVQKALAELQKDLGRGRRHMVGNVQQLLRNQRRDMGKLNRALSADMRSLQKALTEEPIPPARRAERPAERAGRQLPARREPARRARRPAERAPTAARREPPHGASGPRDEGWRLAPGRGRSRVARCCSGWRRPGSYFFSKRHANRRFSSKAGAFD